LGLVPASGETGQSSRPALSREQAGITCLHTRAHLPAATFVLSSRDLTGERGSLCRAPKSRAGAARERATLSRLRRDSLGLVLGAGTRSSLHLDLRSRDAWDALAQSNWHRSMGDRDRRTRRAGKVAPASGGPGSSRTVS